MRTLKSINIEAACTADGKPVCKVEVGNMAGQLTPAEVRVMALAWLCTAEAAEQDAMVLSALTDPEGMACPLEVAAPLIMDIRNRRSEVQGLGEIDALPENLTVDQRQSPETLA